jgi:hypothetical protein
MMQQPLLGHRQSDAVLSKRGQSPRIQKANGV